MKWVGGKRQLLPELRRRVPDSFGRYHEPFVGGGALFFALHPPRAVLSDMNLRLVRTYRGIQKNVDDVIALLKTYPYERAFFEDVRSWPIDQRSDAEVAAWFVYLNKTGFNGLYRVNSRNIYNVPFGRFVNPNICDEENLRACSAALASVELIHGSFADVASRAQPGDFVYFDPPYVPLTATSYFTSYTSDGFGMEEQIELRDLALKLKNQGVHVLLSNSGAQAVRELYKDRFEMIEVQATRMVNSKGSARGKIAELVMF